MSDPTSIFNNENSQAPLAQPAVGNTASTPNTSPLVDLLGQIKNERGEPKYKSVEDALVALKHSQEYIPQLSQQLSQSQADLEAARKAGEKIAELESVVNRLTRTDQNTQTEPVKGMTSEQVAELVNSTLSRKATEDQHKSNTATVANAIASKFGQDAEKVFYGKAMELGMSAAEFNSMAARTPKAVLGLLGITDTAVPKFEGKQSTQGTSLNTAGIQPNVTSYVGKNSQPMMIGATTQQIREESARSVKMVEELHAQGKTVHDLTDPKVFFKYFN